MPVRAQSKNSLELFDHSHVPEPPQVIIEAARVTNCVAELESEGLGRILTENIGHTHRESGVIQDSLPARHGVRNGRRFFLLAYHFLAALGVPRHRRRFHWRREDQAVRELRVCEPGGMHPVAFPEAIKLLGKELFPVSIHKVHGPVHVPLVPRPVEGRVPLPFEPALWIDWIPEVAANKPFRTGATSYLPRPFTGEIDDHLVQITPSA